MLRDPMKRLTLVFVGCLLAVVGLGLVIQIARPTEHATVNTALGQVLPVGTEPIITPQPNPTGRVEYDHMTPAPDVQSAENVPMYPGARDVLTRTSVYQHHLPDTIFYTDDSLSEITAFYREILPKLGWHLVGEGIESYASGQTFMWSDPNGNKQSPYRLI